MQVTLLFGASEVVDTVLSAVGVGAGDARTADKDADDVVTVW